MEVLVSTYQHPETYTGLTVTAYDVDFGGTSSACPTATGWITTKLQYNRTWLWSDIKTWLKNQCGPQNPRSFTWEETKHLGLQLMTTGEMHTEQITMVQIS